MVSRRRPPAGAGELGSDQHVRSRVAVASRLYLGREDSDIWFGRKETVGRGQLDPQTV